MESALKRLDKWLQEKRPDLKAALRPGATDAELNKLETAVEAKLPAAYRTLYKWHNGQNDILGFFASYTFMPIEEVIEAWEGAYAVSAPDNAKDGREFNAKVPNWIPFLHANGMFICVDVTGSGGGKPGQVVDDEGEPYYLILAPTLENWLECYVSSLELGHWQPDDEGVEYLPTDLTGERGTLYGKMLAQRFPGYPLSVDRD